MLVLAPYVWPAGGPPGWIAVVVGGMVALSAVLVVWAILRIRAVERNRDCLRIARGPSRFARAVRWLAECRRQPALDDNPVLWREWRRGRPSRLARVVWGLFTALALLGTAWGIVLIGNAHAEGAEFLALSNGFQATLGLLLVSIAVPTVLAEERLRGSLDVLLASPLSTERIVLAKWWGAYRVVPALALLPAIGALAIAMGAPDSQLHTVASRGLNDPPSALDRIVIATLPVALLLAQGAVVTSMGLALATWIGRVGRAMVVSVASYALVAFGWVVLLEIGIISWIFEWFRLVDPSHRETESFLDTILVSVCPIGGQVAPLVSANGSTVQDRIAGYLGHLIVLLATLGLALLVLGLTLVTFDRCVGRVPERPRRAPRPPRGAGQAPEPHVRAVGDTRTVAHFV
jgi:ABC-type transport system involved in multi-copper enzyme maturation permease subunit